MRRQGSALILALTVVSAAAAGCNRQHDNDAKPKDADSPRFKITSHTKNWHGCDQEGEDLLAPDSSYASAIGHDIDIAVAGDGSASVKLCGNSVCDFTSDFELAPTADGWAGDGARAIGESSSSEGGGSSCSWILPKATLTLQDDGRSFVLEIRELGANAASGCDMSNFDAAMPSFTCLSYQVLKGAKE